MLGFLKLFGANDQLTTLIFEGQWQSTAMSASSPLFSSLPLMNSGIDVGTPVAPTVCLTVVAPRHRRPGFHLIHSPLDGVGCVSAQEEVDDPT